MQNVRFVGLDVHKDSITIAVADGDGSAPAVVATVPHELRALFKQLKKLGAFGRLKCCYEAGPTGFGLYRTLQSARLHRRYKRMQARGKNRQQTVTALPGSSRALFGRSLSNRTEKRRRRRIKNRKVKAAGTGKTRKKGNPRSSLGHSFTAARPPQDRGSPRRTHVMR